MYALVPCDNRGGADHDLVIEVQQMLSEFVDLMPEEFPLAFLFYLVPGSSFSNRPMYRLSPKEFEELQCQVVELLERGYFRVSMSLCTVLILLVPKKDDSLVLYFCG